MERVGERDEESGSGDRETERETWREIQRERARERERKREIDNDRQTDTVTPVSSRSVAGMVGLAQNGVRLASNGTNPGLF